MLSEHDTNQRLEQVIHIGNERLIPPTRDELASDMPLVALASLTFGHFVDATRHCRVRRDAVHECSKFSHSQESLLMKKFAALLVASAALTALSSTSLQAQTSTCPDGTGNLAAPATACTHTHTLSTTVYDILLLTVTSSTPNATALGNPTSVNYAPQANIGSATPLPALTSPNVKVVANKAFQVSIAAATTNFTGSGAANKPAGDVEWAQSGASTTFLALSTTGAPVMSGIGTPNTNRNLTFQSRWAFERDVPGTYSLVVTLTLAAN